MHQHQTDKLIVHFATIPQGRPSGVGSAVYAQTRALRKIEGVETDLVVTTASALDDIGSVLAQPRGASLAMIRKLRAHIGPKIAVLHGVYRPETVAIWLLLLILRIPYVVVSHGGLSSSIQEKSPRRKAIWRRLFLTPMVKRARGVQFLSHGEMIQSIFPDASNARIVPNFVEIPDGLPEREVGLTGMKYLFLGRKDIHHKGLDLLLDAVAITAEDLRAANAFIELRGPDHHHPGQSLEALIAERNVQDLITLAPAVAGDEKRAAFEDADIFLHTSRYEGEPTAVLEAMSYGLPALVTRGTNMYEIVSEHDLGWVCETDVHSIAAAIQLSLRDFQLDEATRQQLRQRARTWVIDNRSKAAVLQTQLDAYFG